MRFEVYGDTGGNGRWRLVAGNGQTVAASGEAFASITNAKRAAGAFRDNATGSTFEVYVDGGGDHRWRAKSPNGQTVASSGESFSSQANAQTSADNVRANAGTATGP